MFRWEILDYLVCFCCENEASWENDQYLSDNWNLTVLPSENLDPKPILVKASGNIFIKIYIYNVIFLETTRSTVS